MSRWLLHRLDHCHLLSVHRKTAAAQKSQHLRKLRSTWSYTCRSSREFVMSDCSLYNPNNEHQQDRNCLEKISRREWIDVSSLKKRRSMYLASNRLKITTCGVYDISQLLQGDLTHPIANNSSQSVLRSLLLVRKRGSERSYLPQLEILRAHYDRAFCDVNYGSLPYYSTFSCIWDYLSVYYIEVWEIFLEWQRKTCSGKTLRLRLKTEIQHYDRVIWRQTSYIIS